MSNDVSRYIYGVVRVEGDTPVTSGAEKEVDVVTHNGMACLVRDGVRKDYLTAGQKALATDLVTHQTVIGNVMKTQMIIPLKFGTFLEDDSEVIELLKKGENLFTELLDTVDGRIELDVVSSWNDLDTIIKEIGETNEEIINLKREVVNKPSEDLFEASLQVGAMVKTALDEKREYLQAEIIAQLTQLSVDHQTHDLMEDKMILNCAFLVPEQKEDAFDKSLHGLDEKYDSKIDFRCVGPLPPYSFSTCEVARPDFEEIDFARHVFGLEDDRATANDIKAAYRNLIKTEHPDLSSDSDAQKRFEEIESAYRILLDYSSGGEVSFRAKDIDGSFTVRPFDVAGTRTFNR